MASNGRAQATVEFHRRFEINDQARREQLEEVILPVSALRNNFFPDTMDTEVGREVQNSGETLKCLWPALSVFRILGLCPISKQGNHLLAPRSLFSPYWLPTYLLVICQFIYFFNYILKLTKGSAEETESWIEIGMYFTFIWHTFTNTVIAIWKIKMLPQLLIKCKRAEAICKKYGPEIVAGSARGCLVLFAILEAAHVLSMSLYFSSSAIQRNVTNVSHYFETLNNEHFRNQEGVACYSGILISISEIFLYAGWNFGDVLLCLLPLILTRYFTRLNGALADRKHNSVALDSLRRDHLQLCRTVQLCDGIFSPLFLAAYIANIVFLFARLYLVFQDDFQHSNSVVKIESIYVTLYLLFARIFLPSFKAAWLNEKVQDGWAIIRQWKPHIIGPDRDSRIIVIKRFMSQVGAPIGMSGWGYFVITKSFITTLFSVLLTYEIIIAQLQISANTPLENDYY